MVVTISCKLRLLLARVNVERAKQGKSSLSLRCLAKESGVSLSALTALNTGRSQRIDYSTIDHLLNYFSAYFTVTTSDLLVWEQAGDSEQHMSVIAVSSKRIEKEAFGAFPPPGLPTGRNIPGETEYAN